MINEQCKKCKHVVHMPGLWHNIPIGYVGLLQDWYVHYTNCEKCEKERKKMNDKNTETLKKGFEAAKELGNVKVEEILGDIVRIHIGVKPYRPYNDQEMLFLSGNGCNFRIQVNEGWVTYTVGDSKPMKTIDDVVFYIFNHDFELEMEALEEIEDESSNDIIIDYKLFLKSINKKIVVSILRNIEKRDIRDHIFGSITIKIFIDIDIDTSLIRSCLICLNNSGFIGLDNDKKWVLRYSAADIINNIYDGCNLPELETPESPKVCKCKKCECGKVNP